MMRIILRLRKSVKPDYLHLMMVNLLCKDPYPAVGYKNG